MGCGGVGRSTGGVGVMGGGVGRSSGVVGVMVLGVGVGVVTEAQNTSKGT